MPKPTRGRVLSVTHKTSVLHDEERRPAPTDDRRLRTDHDKDSEQMQMLTNNNSISPTYLNEFAT